MAELVFVMVFIHTIQVKKRSEI